jgi:hypothetical protein
LLEHDLLNAFAEVIAPAFGLDEDMNKTKHKAGDSGYLKKSDEGMQDQSSQMLCHGSIFYKDSWLKERSFKEQEHEQ